MQASSLPPPKQSGFIPEKRDVKKVPFVEFFDGRLQGVVSSGSDIKRVYVSFFEMTSLDYYCSTNNNRPCGGLRGHPCKHLTLLLSEAIKQHGLAQTVNLLRVPGDQSQITTEYDILSKSGMQIKDPASAVFSRFLAYLQLLEIPSSNSPLHEMDWFGC